MLTVKDNITYPELIGVVRCSEDGLYEVVSKLKHKGYLELKTFGKGSGRNHKIFLTEKGREVQKWLCSFIAPIALETNLQTR